MSIKNHELENTNLIVFPILKILFRESDIMTLCKRAGKTGYNTTPSGNYH